MIDLRKVQIARENAEKKYPFGLEPPKLAAQLRAFADKIEAREVIISGAIFLQEASEDDFAGQCLYVEFSTMGAESA